MDDGGVELVRVVTVEEREAAARSAATVVESAPAAAAAATPPRSGRSGRKRKRATAQEVAVVKTEADGGWTAEFQPLRQKPFDEKEYKRLHELFFTEYAVEAGARESRTRRGTLRTTVRRTGTTTRIAEWPRLQEAVQQLHEADEKEEALKHLRCLEHYMQRVSSGSLPRALRADGAASGFADGEVVELLDSDDEQGTAPEVIDVEAELLGPIRQGRVRVKQEKSERQPRKRSRAGTEALAEVKQEIAQAESGKVQRKPKRLSKKQRATLDEQLWEAAQKGDVAAIERLAAEGASPSAKKHGRVPARMPGSRPHGKTALMWAANNGEVECARALLAGGADRTPRATGGYWAKGKTALQMAEQMGKAEVAALLRE
eukprot:COSAG04_NODE_5749_length_1504_cov_0.949466_2_plen_374_part_00